MALNRVLKTELMGEIASITVGFFGLFLSLIGMGVLLTVSAMTRQWEAIIGCSVYGTSLVLLFGASLLYHVTLATDYLHQKAFEVVDHCAIFLLIAGTFTPMCLLVLKGSTGLWMMALLWGVAALGCLHKILFPVGSDWVSTGVYVGMGWSAVLVYKPLMAGLQPGGMTLLIIGGLMYTLGSLFYVFDHKFRLAHAIWHLCVIGGSLCLYLAILLYVLRPLAGI